MTHFESFVRYLPVLLLRCFSADGKRHFRDSSSRGIAGNVCNVFVMLLGPRVNFVMRFRIDCADNARCGDYFMIFVGFVKRKLFQIWSERAESIDKLSSEVVPNTFHDMEIYPSSSQVHEMLHCAKECSKRQESDYITFGEFCVYASELKPCYDTKVPRPTPLSKNTKTSRKLSHRRRSSTTRSSKYEVFLGGSCNPTTWRKDIAIPFLKNKGITYYNPQVAMWVPELIELENQAKQNAEVMFFVIDNQTRSVASMIEASHIAGTMRKLILVVHEFEKPGTVIFGETVTEKEFRDLQQGHRYLQDIVERQGIPVFHNISDALKSTATVVQRNIKPQDLTLQDDARPVKMAYLKIGDKLIKLREVFDDLDADSTGLISLQDICMAFKILTSAELPIDNLKNIISNQKSVFTDSIAMSETKTEEIRVDFNQFCCIMTELQNQEGHDSQHLDSLKNKASQFFCSALSPLSKLLHWPTPESKASRNENDVSFSAEYRHIYLGGTAKPSLWREDIAIPLIKKKGLTYFVPHNGVWSERLIPLEAANIENSQVLLFVITADSRSLAEMIVAVHYIGLGCQVVLCIQYIADDTVIDGEKLSTQAVKDYNRGRVYLSDLATRAGVPVFQNISEATACAINMCLSRS